MEGIKEKLILLVRIATLFNENDITYGLGASAMLYLRGIVEDFHDLDIMVLRDDFEKASVILKSLGEQAMVKRNPKYSSLLFHRYLIDGIEVDLLGDYIINKDGVDYDMSMNEKCEDSFMIEDVRIPLCSLEKWKKRYELMGRNEKVAIIANYEANQAKMAISRDLGVLLKGVIPVVVMTIGILSGIIFRNKRK